MSPAAPVPFIVGYGRSGTTLLRLMLDSHPKLAIPPETSFVPRLIRACDAEGATAESVHELLVAQKRWPDMGLDAAAVLERWRALPRFNAGDMLRALFSLYAEQQGKPRWGEKTPSHCRNMVAIEGALPEVRFIHSIRDGRDAVLSMRKVPKEIRARDTTDIAELAGRWAMTIRRTRRQGRRVAHYAEVHFEQLVTDPESELRRLCEFLELDFDPAVLAYHERSAQRLDEFNNPLARDDGEAAPGEDRIGVFALTAEPPRTDRIEVWRHEMEARDQLRFETVAGPVLRRLGYPLVGQQADDPDQSLSP